MVTEPTYPTLQDIPFAEIADGRRWRLLDPEDLDHAPLPQARCEPVTTAAAFEDDDLVAYAALAITAGGGVKPLLLVKRVGDLDYGGDYLERRGGRWCQLGFEPDPAARTTAEWIADPLPHDPSFEAGDQDLRAEHRRQFAAWKDQLRDSPTPPAGVPAPPSDDAASHIVLRPPAVHWGLTLFAFAATAGITALAFGFAMAWWVRLSYAVILASFVLAFADLATQKLVLAADRLVIVAKLRRREIARSAIEAVTWGKGEGTYLRLHDGTFVVLPAVGPRTLQGLANVVRAWLKRTA